MTGPLVLGYFALSMLNSSGALGSLTANDIPHWILVIYSLLTFGVALATPVLFIIASVGGMTVPGTCLAPPRSLPPGQVAAADDVVDRRLGMIRTHLS